MKELRQLYLLRHAKSDWADPGTPDHERPLAERGRRAAVALREYLAAHSVRLDLVLCSPAVRTRETWAAIAAGVTGDPEIRFEPAVYEATTGALLDLVQQVDAGVDAMLLVGHNPGIGDLALGLADAGDVGSGGRDGATELRGGYPTGGLACFTLGSSWADLGRDGARLERFVRPRELPGG